MTEQMFADTFYWVALLSSPRNTFHRQAISITSKLGKSRVVTTDEVLIEVLNFLSDGGENLRVGAVNKYGSAASKCRFRKGVGSISISCDLFSWIRTILTTTR
jgi:hypothetical protein